MPNNSKKPTFGTLSAITLFFVTFLVIFAVFTWAVLTFGLRITGNNSDFGAGMIFAIVIVPTLIVAAIIAWLVASTTGKKFHDKVIPENKTSGMVVWGLSMSVPGWIIGLIVWNSSVNLPKANILIPAAITGILQLTMLFALGLLGKSNDRTRRKAWGVLLCIAILITPFVVLKIAAR